MKNLFGVKKDGTAPYTRFEIRSLSEESQSKLDDSKEVVATSFKKALPTWISILASVITFIGACILEGILDSDATITESYNHAPYLFYICGACLLAGLGLFAYIGIRKYKLKQDPLLNSQLDVINELTDQAILELKVPDTSVFVDVIFPMVKENDHGVEKEIWSNSYQNVPLHVFEENGKICFADCYSVFAIPRECFKSITMKKKRKSISNWNKEEGVKSEKYKPYKLRKNDQGGYIIKSLYKVLLEIDGEQFEIFIPNYDIELFRTIVPIEILEDGKENEVVSKPCI